MTYSVELGAGTCSASQWAVLGSDGETLGCHDSQAAAGDQLAKLQAEGLPGRMMGARELVTPPPVHIGTERTPPTAHAPRIPRKG